MKELAMQELANTFECYVAITNKGFQDGKFRMSANGFLTRPVLKGTGKDKQYVVRDTRADGDDEELFVITSLGVNALKDFFDYEDNSLIYPQT